jgi:hypothetical protein
VLMANCRACGECEESFWCGLRGREMVVVALSSPSAAKYWAWRIGVLRLCGIFLRMVSGFGYCDTIMWVLYEYDRAS